MSDEDVLESRDFYEICQQYRHERHDPHVSMAFERLKDWIRTNCFVGKKPVNDEGWLTGDSRPFKSTEIRFCPSCEKDWLE